jgi:hypothetical protein
MEYEFPYTPITEETFERQGWEMVVENEEGEEGEMEEFYYFVLPLPKDNPDEHSPILISSANDDWETLGINNGEYYVELDNSNGLGLCTNEEELEILYRALTRNRIE